MCRGKQCSRNSKQLRVAEVQEVMNDEANKRDRGPDTGSFVCLTIALGSVLVATANYLRLRPGSDMIGFAFRKLSLAAERMYYMKGRKTEAVIQMEALLIDR